MAIQRKTASKLGVLLQLGLLCLVWVGVISMLQLVSNAPLQHPFDDMLRSRHRGARFVFADLDGDQKPDLARVETRSQRSESANYFIHLRLSRGTESAIGVRAPFGGLEVAARDVNGDDNLDLILTSNLDAGFIEVLLNDGHGNFSVAPPDILERENESELGLSGPAGPQVGRATIALVRALLDERLVRDSGYDQVSGSESRPPVEVHPALQRSAFSNAGRSPPLAVFL
jgi:hypothetical protein